jgi:hypothetical protein
MMLFNGKRKMDSDQLYKKILEEQRKRRLERKGDSLYFVQARETGRIKIGRSKNPSKRLKALQTGNAQELRLIASLEGLGWREKDLHHKLREWRVSGEWFDYECVGNIPDEIYELIPFGGLDDWWLK